jgi:hypothetical protein
MGDFRILWDNKFDAATLASNSEAAGFDVERLQHEWFLKSWRSAGLSNVTVDANLGTPEDIKAFFAYYHNLRVGASLKIQADDDSGYGSLGLDDTIAITAAMASLGIVGKFWGTAQAYRYWRQLISDDASGHSQGYIREGRVFLGDYFQPAHRPSVQEEPTDVDPSVIIASLGGQEQANILTPYRRIVYTWEALPESDITILKTIFALVGRSMPYFIIEDSADPINTLRYVKNIADWTYGPVVNGWRSLTIEVKTER